MTPEQFVYWLQGFVEVANPMVISAQQFQVIKDHLKLVFCKVTPERSELVEHQTPDVDLQQIFDELRRGNSGTIGPDPLKDVVFCCGVSEAIEKNINDVPMDCEASPYSQNFKPTVVYQSPIVSC